MSYNLTDLLKYVRQGRVFAGGTAATGVAPGTAIGTTAAFSLYNASANTVCLVPIKVTMGYVSGTLGAGVVHYLSNITATATTGTAITATNCRTDSARTAQGAALTTATIPSPTILRPFCSLQASLASTAVAPWQVVDLPMGEFCLYPGSTLSLHATAAAGSSPLVVFGMSWLELPV